jgi:glutathione S-transferase
MIYPVAAGLSRAAGERPHMQAWLDRMKSRPAYQRAEAKGGTAVPPGK